MSYNGRVFSCSLLLQIRVDRNHSKAAWVSFLAFVRVRYDITPGSTVFGVQIAHSGDLHLCLGDEAAAPCVG